MPSPDTTGQDAAPPLPPLLAAFLFSRINPGAANSVAEAVLRVASEQHTAAAVKGKTE